MVRIRYVLGVCDHSAKENGYAHNHLFYFHFHNYSSFYYYFSIVDSTKLYRKYEKVNKTSTLLYETARLLYESHSIGLLMDWV